MDREQSRQVVFRLLDEAIPRVRPAPPDDDAEYIDDVSAWIARVRGSTLRLVSFCRYIVKKTLFDAISCQEDTF